MDRDNGSDDSDDSQERDSLSPVGLDFESRADRVKVTGLYAEEWGSNDATGQKRERKEMIFVSSSCSRSCPGLGLVLVVIPGHTESSFSRNHSMIFLLFLFSVLCDRW